MSSSRRYFLPVIAVLTGMGVGMANVPAAAAGLRMTVERPHFTCERHGALPSRVVYHPGESLAAQPVLPCCDGQFGCAQFLSTNTVLRQTHRWHS